MNKIHWNTVALDGLSLEFLQQMIAHSYQMVWQKLPLKLRTQS
jgi:predicted DNA-binding protein (MmcQ/YjbR family)